MPRSYYDSSSDEYPLDVIVNKVRSRHSSTSRHRQDDPSDDEYPPGVINETRSRHNSTSRHRHDDQIYVAENLLAVPEAGGRHRSSSTGAAPQPQFVNVIVQPSERGHSYDRRHDRYLDTSRETIIIRRDEREDDRISPVPTRSRNDYSLGRPISHERERSRVGRGNSEHDDEIIIRRDERDEREENRRPPPPRDFEREEIIIRRDEREPDIVASDKDITVHLDLDVQIDISEDIDALAHLNRLGRFKEAFQLFEEKLQDHLDFFPVVAEYADLLLEQGSYGRLSEFLSERLNEQEDGSVAKFALDEELLLKSLKALAEVYSKGALRPALSEALHALKYFEDLKRTKRLWFNSPSGIQIQLVEIYVRIVTFAQQNSTFLRNGSFRRLSDLMLCKHEDPVRMKTGGLSPTDLGGWYRTLQQNGFYWESHRLLRATPPAVEPEDDDNELISDLKDFFQVDSPAALTNAFVRVEDIQEQTEQVLITEFANASLLSDYLTLLSEELLNVWSRARQDCLDRAKSLALVILTDYPHVVNSRPYLEWMLREQARSRLARLPAKLIAASRRIVPSSLNKTNAGKWWYLEDSAIGLALEDSREALSCLSGSQDQHFFNVIAQNAEQLGDYQTQMSAFQELSHCQEFPENLQTWRRLSSLQLDVMEDAPGYLECLTEEYMLLEFLRPTDRQRLEKSLTERFNEFDRSFPFNGEIPIYVRNNLNQSLFDVPLIKWVERRVQVPLLNGLGRRTEAEVAKAQSEAIKIHLPRGKKNRCRGCYTCNSDDQHSPKRYRDDEYYYEREVRAEPENGEKQPEKPNKNATYQSNHALVVSKGPQDTLFRAKERERGLPDRQGSHSEEKPQIEMPGDFEQQNPNGGKKINSDIKDEGLHRASEERDKSAGRLSTHDLDRPAQPEAEPKATIGADNADEEDTRGGRGPSTKRKQMKVTNPDDLDEALNIITQAIKKQRDSLQEQRTKSENTLEISDVHSEAGNHLERTGDPGEHEGPDQ